ncbi:MAG: argininosuccinate lyase, partial [Lactobacillales bacterium]|nr:argininosuccinate lyase [Lactobacillales bacterium]
EIEAGDFVFQKALEDLHMNIETRLKEIIGASAGKLHTARSRNDQVATDFKIFVRSAAYQLTKDLKHLQHALLILAKEHTKTVMPGFTHLQIAQPISFAFYLHAYFEMFGRDIKRLENARDLMNESPLGSAALAGTPYPIDRFQTAKALLFKSPTKNALDSVSDRDFAVEFLSCTSLIAMHLSRLAEEMVIYSSQSFGFIKIPESYTSGSSIMPQKRNPDAAELVRAKTGRIYGDLNTLLVVMKGLPLAYSKDMQEDKECVFDAYESARLCLSAMAEMIAGLKVNKENMKKALEKGFPTATDLADWLVKNAGIPFRDAHHITGQLVKLAEEKDVALSALSLDEMQKVEPKITAEIYPALDVINSMEARNSYGGTNSNQVMQRLTEALEGFEEG